MNSLLPIFIFCVIIMFVFAFIREAKKQKKRALSFFKKIAETHSWTYRETDTGIIQEILKDFQAVGNFYSPSLGKLPPKNVIMGTAPEGTFYFFQHHRRHYEDYAFQFNVLVLELNRYVAESLIICFKKGKSKLTNHFYTNPELPISEKWTEQIIVYGKNKNESLSLLEDANLKMLIQNANSLPWRVDLQIQKDRMAVYIADRNADIEKESDFFKLKEFAQNAAEVLKKT